MDEIRTPYRYGRHTVFLTPQDVKDWNAYAKEAQRRVRRMTAAEARTWMARLCAHEVMTREEAPYVYTRRPSPPCLDDLRMRRRP